MSNSGKKAVELNPKKVKLHYFPDIPLETSALNTGCTAAKNGFKRIHFESGGAACSGISEAGEDQAIHSQSTK